MSPDDPVGRGEAIARVCRLLETARLVTLTGPGGVGKTTLALAVARAVGGSARVAADPGLFPDGVRLVELAVPAPGREAVAAAVSVALGLRDDQAPDAPVPWGETASCPQAAGSTGPHRLAAALRGRRLLLLLDNCEHVVDEVAALVAVLLRNTSGVRILATSREPLAVAGEVVEEVAPLDEADAVSLFLERAAAAGPEFAPEAADRAVVAAVCRRLDHLPLAIELAAARVRALGVDGVSARLDDRFGLLSAGRRDAPARQRTLRAVIDWSWEPLDEPERAVLRRMAVFRNGCTLEAAEAVCGPGTGTGTGTPAENTPAGNGTAVTVTAGSGAVAPGRGPEPIDPGAAAPPTAPSVLDIVSRLVDRSLVTVVRGDGGTRYRLLESVAAYARERLAEADESAAIAGRHRAWHLARAEHAAAGLYDGGQRVWLAHLDDEAADMRAAFDDAIASGAAPDALRLVNTLSWYWMLRGRLREARRALDAALALAADAAGRPADGVPGHADALAHRAGFALLTGDDAYAGTAVAGAGARATWFLLSARAGFGETAAVDAELTALLGRFRRDGDRWGEAATLGTRAAGAVHSGNLAALRADAVRSASLFADLGDRWGRLRATEQLGVLAEIAGDYAEAARLHHEAVRGAEELRLWTDVSFRLSRLGRIALLTDDVDSADDYHTRARRIARKQSHGPAEQFAVTGLAIGARRRGDLDRAESLLTPWLEWNRRLEVASGEALVLAQLGLIGEQRGDVRRAFALHLEGFDAAARTGDPRAVAYALEGLAGACALAGAHARAAGLLGTADALRTSVGSPLPVAERADVDRAVARARKALGEVGYAKHFDAGRETRPEEQRAHFDRPEAAAAVI